MEVGVAQETISAYEIGRAFPRGDVLISLADFLGTSTDYLLDRTDIKEPVDRLTMHGSNAEELELIAQYRQLNHIQKTKMQGFLMVILESHTLPDA